MATLSDKRRFTPIDEVEETPQTSSRYTPIDEVVEPTNTDRVDARIASRESMIPTATKANVGYTASLFDPRANVRRMLNPLGAQQEFGHVAAANLGAAQEAIETATSAPAIDLLRGRPRDIPRNLVKGFSGERVTERGDVARQLGAPEPIAAAFGLATSPEFVIPAVKGATAMMRFGRPVVGKAVAPLRKGIAETREAFSRAPLPKTEKELLALPEDATAKLPELERARYLAGKAEQVKAGLSSAEDELSGVISAKQRAEKVGFDLQQQQAQQALASKRLAFKQEAQAVAALREQKRVSLSKSLPSTAAKDLEGLEEPFRQISRDHSATWTTGINKALTKAESEALAATGEGIKIAPQELKDAIAKKHLTPGGASGTPGQVQALEDQEHYRALMQRLDAAGLTNQDQISARSLFNLAQEQRISPAAYNKSRAFTPDEVVSQHFKDIVLDLLEQKGVDVSDVRATWKEWVPVRNLGLKLQTPAGPRQLISILKGQDPVREPNLRSLESLLGEPLDTQTKQVFNQLDNLNQQKVLEQAKRAEFERLMQQDSGFYRGQKTQQAAALKERHIAAADVLTGKRAARAKAVAESEANRRLRVEQAARHRNKIRKIVLGVAGGTLGIAGLRTGVGQQVLRTVLGD